MELHRITRQILCKAVEQRATLIHRQYNRDWGTSYSRPPIDPYLTSPLLQNPGGATGSERVKTSTRKLQTFSYQHAEVLCLSTTLSVNLRTSGSAIRPCRRCSESMQYRVAIVSCMLPNDAVTAAQLTTNSLRRLSFHRPPCGPGNASGLLRVCFHRNRSNRFGDIAIFSTLKMASVHHIGYVARAFGFLSLRKIQLTYIFHNAGFHNSPVRVWLENASS